MKTLPFPPFFLTKPLGWPYCGYMSKFGKELTYIRSKLETCLSMMSQFRPKKTYWAVQYDLKSALETMQDIPDCWFREGTDRYAYEGRLKSLVIAFKEYRDIIDVLPEVKGGKGVLELLFLQYLGLFDLG